MSAAARLSQKEAAALGLVKKGNKFGAESMRLDGFLFHSKLEMRRYGELKLKERAGYIRKLRVHKSFPLCVPHAHTLEFLDSISTKKIVHALCQLMVIGTYTPDFVYEELTVHQGFKEWRAVAEDTKGINKQGRAITATDGSALRIRMFEAIYGISVQIIGQNLVSKSKRRKRR